MHWCCSASFTLKRKCHQNYKKVTSFLTFSTELKCNLISPVSSKHTWHRSFLMPLQKPFCFCDVNSQVTVHSVRFVHGGIDAASLELNLSFSRYRCQCWSAMRGFTSSFTLSFYIMKLQPGSVSRRKGKDGMKLVLLAEKGPDVSFCVSWCFIIFVTR